MTNASPDTPFFPATRENGLARMSDFSPRMGRAYAVGRNHDRGPGRHSAVSALSPFVRHRLLLETELIETALGQHGLEGAGKFIQEVVWRSYFKGFLERRPRLWPDYKSARDAELSALDHNGSFAAAYQRAVTGQTGITCFDHWVDELLATGYLHNHARMWFASIWIFTLRLPWVMGADFFLRHLLDGDPASNTLSWRWVGGLHTKGKAYEAQAWNIAKFTDGRFQPLPGQLAENVEPLEWGDGLPEIAPVQPVHSPEPGANALLLITPEDCQPETLIRDERIRDPLLSGTRGIGQSQIVASMAVSTIAYRASPAAMNQDQLIGQHAKRYEVEALQDAISRAAANGLPEASVLPAERNKTARQLLTSNIIGLAKDNGANQIVTAYPPQGPTRDWLEEIRHDLEAAGLSLRTIRREWDEHIWPHATAGFFKVKKKIPYLMEGFG